VLFYGWLRLAQEIGGGFSHGQHSTGVNGLITNPKFPYEEINTRMILPAWFRWLTLPAGHK